MSKIPAFSLAYTQNGMVRSAAVDDTMVPENTCELSLNLHFDRIGVFSLRPGITALGGAIEANKLVLGMTNYCNNAGTNYKLLAKLDTDVYAFDGSAWASVRNSLTAESKARFTNLVDCTFMVNGNANEVCATYSGTGSFGSTNVASLPKGDFIENFRSRIWIADKSTDNVYYSDVVTVSNTITGGDSFIQISPQDGENITGLKAHPRALLVFKQNHVFRLFSINDVDPNPFIFRGTYSQESIVESKAGIFYHHSSGFYQFVFGTLYNQFDQQEISKPIIDIIKAIPRSYYESVTGWCDDDHIYWSIGDITLNSVNLSNVVCRYTISTQVWTIYSYAYEVRSACKYDSGTNLVDTVGCDNGSVYKVDSGNDDGGSPINYDFQTHWLYFTSLKSAKKKITEIASIHENANGAQISFQIDNDLESKWRPIGEIVDDLTHNSTFDSKEFYRIKFRLSGSSTGSPLIFRTWEIINSSTNINLQPA